MEQLLPRKADLCTLYLGGTPLEDYSVKAFLFPVDTVGSKRGKGQGFD